MNPTLRRRHLLALALGLSAPALAASARPGPAGRLMLVGGTGAAAAHERILSRFIGLCGGSAARIVVLTTGEPTANGNAQALRLRELGVSALALADAGAADQDESLALLERADGILIAGDDAPALVRALRHTEALRALQQALARGACVAAVGAGAAALSDVVPSGEGAAFPQLDAGLALAPGLLVDARIDQPRHMQQLMFALTLLPAHLGVGLEADTALVIEAGRGVEVIGPRGVMLADGRSLWSAPAGTPTWQVAPGTTQDVKLGEGLGVQVSGGEQGTTLTVLGLDANTLPPARESAGPAPMVGARLHHLPAGGYWLDAPGMAQPLERLVVRLVETLAGR